MSTYVYYEILNSTHLIISLLIYLTGSNVVGVNGVGSGELLPPGLNLSTNNGLDLSLTTYEGLNLSQNNTDEQQHQNTEGDVLNLTQAPTGVVEQQLDTDQTQTEVGLNLR